MPHEHFGARAGAGRRRAGRVWTVPEVDIRICLGTGGVAAGSREVLKAFEEKLAQTRRARRHPSSRGRLRRTVRLGHRDGLPGTVRHGPAGRGPHATERRHAARSPTARSPPPWSTRSSPSTSSGGEPIEKWIVTDRRRAHRVRRLLRPTGEAHPAARRASSIPRRSRTTSRPTAIRLCTRSSRA